MTACPAASEPRILAARMLERHSYPVRFVLNSGTP
jgi:hypothetical protein